MLKLLLFAVLFGYINAMNKVEMKMFLTNQILSCASKYKAKTSDLLQLENLVLPDNPEVKCVLSCMYKNLGSMDKKGMYDVKGAEDLVEKLHPGEGRKKYVGLCSKVNDAKVSDGAKGCERAALLFKCNVEHKDKFGI